MTNSATPAAPAPKQLAKLRDGIEFREHQIEGIRWMASNSSFLLADEMGLGKSLQSLAVVAVDFEKGWAKRVLVIVPAGLKYNWADEIERWTLFSYTVLEGTPAKRDKMLAEFNDDVLIINYEQVAKHLDQLNALGFDIVILDEAHAIKGHRSQRTKAVHKLKAERFFLLTGSPVLNRADELWSLLHRIDPAKYPNYWRWVNAHCLFGGFKGKQVTGVKRPKELRDKVSAVMLRRLKSECLDLPEKQYIKIHVDMNPGQRRLYNQAFDEMQITLPDDPDPMQLESALTRFLRLKQICSTPANLGLEDDSAKLDVAVDKIVELVDNGHKVVVFTQFRGTLAALEARLDHAKVPTWQLHGDVPKRRRQELAKEWTDSSEPGVLAAMLQVAGVGLTFTAARHCIFLDKLYTPKLNEQAEDRLHRIGASTTQPVQIIDLICRKSIEYRVEQILEQKRELFDSLVETSGFKRALYAALREGEA